MEHLVSKVGQFRVGKRGRIVYQLTAILCDSDKRTVEIGSKPGPISDSRVCGITSDGRRSIVTRNVWWAP